MMALTGSGPLARQVAIPQTPTASPNGSSWWTSPSAPTVGRVGNGMPRREITSNSGGGGGWWSDRWNDVKGAVDWFFSPTPGGPLDRARQPQSNATVRPSYLSPTVFDPAKKAYVSNPLYAGPAISTNGRPASTALPTPTANLGLLQGVRNAMETMYGPQFSALDRQTQLLLMEQELRRRGLDEQLNALGPDNELRKQRIDLSIGNAGREIGRVQQGADSTNWLAAQNLQRSLQGGQDWINSQGQLVNSQIGDLNIQAAGSARDIEYGNQRLALAFQALGLSRDDYVNAQNVLNSRQQNVNTLTNLESADTQRDYANRKRDTYDDAVARGGLASTGARADLRDIDQGLRTAQDRLRENLRQSTEEIRGQRESARTQYGRSELDYQGTEAGIRNEQEGARDRIRLYENQGERLRTSYAYDIRERERQMQGERDSTQNAITQTNLNRDSTIDGLTTNIAQWGIDKQLLDQQLMDSARKLGLEKEFMDLDYQTRTGQISQEKAALFAEMQKQILAYTPIVQQNPWILGIQNNQSSQSRQQPNRGPNRAV